MSVSRSVGWTFILLNFHCPWTFLCNSRLWCQWVISPKLFFHLKNWNFFTYWLTDRGWCWKMLLHLKSVHIFPEINWKNIFIVFLKGEKHIEWRVVCNRWCRFMLILWPALEYQTEKKRGEILLRRVSQISGTNDETYFFKYCDHPWHTKRK